MSRALAICIGGSRIVLAGLLIERAGDTEIEQNWRFVCTDQNVGRLQIAVDDEALMGELHGRADFLEQLQARTEIEMVVGAKAFDGNPFDMLHDEIRLAAWRGSSLIATC